VTIGEGETIEIDIFALQLGSFFTMIDQYSVHITADAAPMHMFISCSLPSQFIKMLEMLKVLQLS